MLLGRPLDHPRVKMLIEEEWYPGLLESDSKGRIVTVQDKGKPTEKKYSTEELLAMVLQYGKAITKAYAPKFVKSQIRDCVMTVPSFYTQHERQALLDTASIAGLKAKLIDENTAAAVQYAVDRVFNKTTKVLFYNLGANSLQVSIATFSSKKPKGEKKKVEKFAVNAKTFDETIGGRTFENKLMNFMADKFNEGRSGKPDIRKNLKAMAKMVTVAQKSKKTLSASKSTFIKMESLFEGDTLAVKITRDEFEEMCADLFPRVTPAIDEALKQAKLTKDDIDEVELIGGGWRVPKIAEMLEAYFTGKELGTHLNSDESFVMGAAFQAANNTGRSKCKFIGMTDVYPFPISIALSGRDKEIPVFKKNAKIGTRKIVKFGQEKDFEVTLKYGEDRPAGSAEKIAVYSVSGVSDFADANPGAKVELQIFLDANGIAKVTKAKGFIEKGASELLTVELTNKGIAFQALSEAEKKASTAVLAEFEAKEAAKLAKQDARNVLENYLYKLKEMSTPQDAEEEEEGFEASEDVIVFGQLPEDQQQEIKDVIMDTNEWLDDEAEVGEPAVYEAKFSEVEAKVEGFTKEIRMQRADAAAAKREAEEEKGKDGEL